MNKSLIFDFENSTNIGLHCNNIAAIPKEILRIRIRDKFETKIFGQGSCLFSLILFKLPKTREAV